MSFSMRLRNGMLKGFLSLVDAFDHTGLDKTQQELGQIGIHINHMVYVPLFNAATIRPVFKLLGGNVETCDTPAGLEHMATERNPRTMRSMEATRNFRGTWDVQKLSFASMGRGYSQDNVRRIRKGVSFQEALRVLIEFSKITSPNPVEHPKYRQVPTLRR